MPDRLWRSVDAALLHGQDLLNPPSVKDGIRVRVDQQWLLDGTYQLRAQLVGDPSLPGVRGIIDA